MSSEATMQLSDPRGEQFDRAIEWLLIGLLAFMPLAFGAVEAWSEEIVILLAGAMAMCFLLRAVVTKQAPLIWTWAYIPIAVFILIAVVQVVPIPAAAARLISPNTMARKSVLLGDLANAGDVLSAVTISFYPCATKHDLRLVLAVAAVFVVVLNVFRRPEQIVRLLKIIAAFGAGVAMIALAQNLFGNGMIYWFVSSPHDSAHSGPFVNHSHYAQFMNLSVGAALGLLLVRVQEQFPRHNTTPKVVADYLGSPDSRQMWALFGVMVLGVGTVFLSMARGGIISALIAGALTTLVLSSRRPLRGSGWIMALLALGAFICVLYTGFDAVYDRLATLREPSRAEGGRWQIVKDITVAWTRFPVFGTGLGTHEVVYPEFDRSTIPALASHAENEYAQAAEETGATGLAALVAFGVLVFVHYVRAVKRSSHTPVCMAAYGLGFGLVAILVHSLSDFGQHLPSNAILTVIFCALLIRLPSIGSGEGRESGLGVAISGRRRGCWIAGLVLFCVVCAWAVLGADGARRAEGHWGRVMAAEQDLLDRGWEGSDEEYVYLLRHAEKAVRCQPDNVKYQHWLNVYRWHAISRTFDPNTGEIVLPAEALKFAERITDGFNAARALCPTYGATWCVLGQLERSVLGRVAEGTRHIREGVKLAPCDPTARLVAGILAAEEDQIDLALEHLKVAVQLDPRLFGEVAEQLINRFGQPDLALQIAGESIHMLSMIADVLEASDDSTGSAEHIRDKFVALLEQRCQEPMPPAWALASLANIYRQDGEVTEAIECYRRALSQQYGMVDWRFSLARLYADTGAVDRAIEEARRCLRFRPEHAASRQLIEKLSAEQRSR